MASTYTPIATYTAPSAQSSYTFNSFAGYTDLILVANYTTTSANVDVRFQVNGDTGANYSYTYMIGNGSAAGSGRLANSAYIGGYFSVGTSTNGNISIYQLMNYANTTTYKTVLQRMSSAEKELTANVGMWRNTAAITSATIYTSSSTFAAGSTFTLYGIKAA